MRRALLLTAYSLLLTAYCLPQTACSEPIPVNIKADNLKFYESSSLIEASGSVEVKLERATIAADRLVLDSATNIVTAEGSVRLLSGDYDAAAAKLVYEADRDRAGFASFEAVLRPNKMKGELYLLADELRDDGENMSGRGADLSTCQNTAPHYYLLADQVGYYPDDHLDARNVTFYVGELPVLWLPYFYYDLKSDRRRNWKFGQNQVEGSFIKSSWPYWGGLLLVDYMSKKGWGIGTETPYNAGAWGLGTLKLYNNNEADTGHGDWVEKIDHTIPLRDKTTLRLTQSYNDIYQVPSGRIENTGLGLELTYISRESTALRLNYLDDRWGRQVQETGQFNYLTEGTAANYSFNYQNGKDEPHKVHGSQRFTLARELLADNRLKLSTSAGYLYDLGRRGDNPAEKVEPQIELTGQERDFNWRLTENWLIDLQDELATAEPRYEALEKQPELEIRPRSLNLGLFTLNSTFGLAKYREVKTVPALGRKRDFTAERVRTALQADRSVPLGPATTLSLGAGVDQYLYGPGDQLYAVSERAALLIDNKNWLRNELNFRQGYTDGNTPFFFDQLGARYHDIRDRLTFYHLNKFSWYFEGGHNWQTSKYFDLMSGVVIEPEKWLRLSLNSGWDLENRRYKELVGSGTWVPADWYNLSLGFTQDMNLGDLKSASALHDFWLVKGAPNQWHFRVSQVLDPSTEELKVRDIMLVKDLHCWEMKFTYSDYLKEYSFVYTLKALPGEPVGFGSGRGFYYDGFDREIGKLSQ
ncbi:MAG: hypothetical protein MUC35_01605 [Candidatus Margulisbacteria bacterium]|nr:hypothetical protein [Candidatus Margulisiibacteriota bacterium]